MDKYFACKNNSVTIILLALLICTSCIPHQRLVNFSEETQLFEEKEKMLVPDQVTIQSNDQLQIQVFGLDEEAVRPFNEFVPGQQAVGQSGELLRGYLVNSEGYIEFPRLGKIKLGGLTREKATQKMRSLLDDYLEEPIVKIGILNFKVTIFGEVANTQIISVANERLTIVEVLAQAGLTPYSVRDKIWIIREENGERIFGTVNLYSRDIFNSPYYYLKQNDVIYVEPTKDVVTTLRQPALAVVPWVSSIIGLGTTIYLLFRNN